MARVAVICGTGMSELTNDFRRKKIVQLQN